MTAKGARGAGAAAGGARRDAPGDGGDGAGGGGVWIAAEDRRAAVAALAQCRLQRHLAEQGDSEISRQRGAATLAEGVRGLAAARAGETGHVLDHADQRLAELLDHLRRSRSRRAGRLLRGRDEHGLGAGQQLPEREADVARAGRHVDQQVVERAPVDIGEELLQRPVQHRPAPHDGAAVVEEEPDRHHLELVGDRRDDHLVHHDGALLDAEHARNRVAVDVGVHDAHLEASRAQGEREVDRQRRLADATLAGGDGDDARALLDGDRAFAVAVAAVQPGAQRGALLLVHVREADGDRADARHGADVRPHLRLDVRLERAPRHREPHRDVHVGAVDVDRVDHAELDHVAPQLGIDDLRKRRLERVGSRARHDGMLPRMCGRLPFRADAEQRGDACQRALVSGRDDARAPFEVEWRRRERAGRRPGAR